MKQAAWDRLAWWWLVGLCAIGVIIICVGIIAGLFTGHYEPLIGGLIGLVLFGVPLYAAGRDRD